LSVLFQKPHNDVVKLIDVDRSFLIPHSGLDEFERGRLENHLKNIRKSFHTLGSGEAIDVREFDRKVSQNLRRDGRRSLEDIFVNLKTDVVTLLREILHTPDGTRSDSMILPDYASCSVVAVYTVNSLSR